MGTWKINAVRVLVLVVIAGLFLFEYLSPTWHFQKERLPISGAPPIAEEPAKPELASAITDTPSFNILLLGIDARKQEKSRADLIMLAQVNLKTKEVVLISIPRDTRVAIEQVGYTKINHAHILGENKGGNHGGTQEMIQAVSSFLATEINYYLKINFNGFKNIIDTIGGLDIELAQPVLLTFSQIQLAAGKHHLNGELTLKLAKERYSLPEGDFGRQKQQHQIIQAIIAKLSQPEYVREWPALLLAAQSAIADTNLSVDDLLSLAWTFKGIGAEQISYIQIPGYSSMAWDPLVRAEVSYWMPNAARVKEIMAQFVK